MAMVMFMSYYVYEFLKIVCVANKKLPQYLILTVKIASKELDLLNLLLIQ